MAKSWYILQTYSQFEHQVKRSLQDKIERDELHDFFGQILIPSEEVVEIKDGKKRNSQRKFFPGYILIEMEMNDKTWHAVKSIPKVSNFVGGDPDKPTAVPQKEIDLILNRVEQGIAKPKPKTLFEIGEELRIIEGPFAEFTGLVEEVNYEKNRLKVSVSIFGRPTPVELEFNQVEKVV